MASVFGVDFWTDAQTKLVEFVLSNPKWFLAAGTIGLIVLAVRKWKQQSPSSAAEVQEEAGDDPGDPGREQQDEQQAPAPAPYRAPIPPPADFVHGQPDDNDLCTRKLRPKAGQE